METVAKCALCSNRINIQNEIHYTFDDEYLCKAHGEYMLAELSKLERIVPTKGEQHEN
ncbi:hypothetical protein LCGC14_0433000 [marine sediment metagenome]|uniref:Uncharacterized protein n=1 Tax=marine sediment metagenome TaxID=412755 RepID=A0A0F9SMP4_9ZZZZ